MSKERQALGKHAELAVAALLEQEGFYICALNYKNRYGEIDVIASFRELLVFVEVKMRQYHYFNLSQVITYKKQKKIVRTALSFLCNHNVSDMSYRFDVALLEISPKGGYTITYIENAFTAPETGDIYLEH